MVTYAKLFSDILASTIWAETPATRLVWITLLAMADRDGIVQASVPGLAHMARVGTAECELALAVLGAPDPDSRTKDFDGRRISAVPGGWLVLNYEKHNARASMEEKRERDRLRQERKRVRDASRSVTPCNAPSRDVTESRLSSVPVPVPGKEGRKEGAAADSPEGDALRRCLSDIGALGRASSKTLETVLVRMLEVGWTPATVHEAAAGMDGKTEKLRVGQLTSVLLDKERFERFHDDRFRRACEARHRGNGR